MKGTVIGTGYVGLVTGVCLTSLGHSITCVDVDESRLKTLQRGEAPFYEPGLQDLICQGFESGRLSATLDLDSAVKNSDFSIIAVGTPPRTEMVDLSYLETASIQLGKALKGCQKYHVVVVKSTVPPGTTDTFVRKLVEENSGLKAGQFGLAMNPEFLREGCAVGDFMTPDRIVIGEFDERSGKVLDDLYQGFNCPRVHTGLRNAELIKYTSNALLSVLISFSNEIANLCEVTAGTDIEEIMDALHLDKRLSPLVDGKRVTPEILGYLRAGIGFGGSCLPKDVSALRMYGRQNRVETPILDAVVKINNQRPIQIAAILEKALGADLSGKTIAVLGLAFKPGTDDLRDSPALAIIRQLLEQGCTVRAFDPLLSDKARSSLDPAIQVYDSPQQVLTGANAVVLATAWPEFQQWDWASLCRLMHSAIILDGRNALRSIQWPIGVKYWTLGRSN